MGFSTASNFIFEDKEFNKNPIKKFLHNLFASARTLNDNGIISLVDSDPKGRVLDLGCDDGNLTISLAKKMGTQDAWGVDLFPERLKIAEKAGIKTVKANLEKKFPFPDSHFDVVTANQIIEHVTNIDHFIGEIYRVLKPGGYTIISTENASSWCNIFASIMGWQIFSLTNFSSKKWGLGNPMALHGGEENIGSVWGHKTVLNYSGLAALLKLYDFEIKAALGSGYFPLPSELGRLDKIHGHFMTFKAQRLK